MVARNREIRAKLDSIQQTKRVIERRLIDTAIPVYDKEGIELTENNINLRVADMAQQISAQYPDEFPLFISLMDGGLPFAAKVQDALSHLGYQYQFSTMQVSSYRGGLKSGELKIGSLPKIAVANRTVILLDDVCDTGKTFGKTKELLLGLGAKRVDLVTMVDKKQPREEGCDPALSGFEVSKDAFIIGYGLDYAGLVRNMPSIKAVDMDALPNESESAILAQEKALLLELSNISRTEQCGTENQQNAANGESSHPLFEQFNFKVIAGFAAVLGLGVMVLSFAVLGLAAAGSAVVLGVGTAAMATGSMLAAKGFFSQKQEQPSADQTSEYGAMEGYGDLEGYAASV